MTSQGGPRCAVSPAEPGHVESVPPTACQTDGDSSKGRAHAEHYKLLSTQDHYAHTHTQLLGADTPPGDTGEGGWSSKCAAQKEKCI